MITGILILFPLICAIILFFLKDVKVVKMVAIYGSLIQLLIALIGLFISTHGCNCDLLLFLGSFPQSGISLRFSLDGISLLLVLLTSFLWPVIILSSVRKEIKNASVYYGLIMLIEMALIGVFSAYDGILFYVFWELVLIPAYFVCAFWGGKDRIRITLKFFSYTFSGSLLMLVALIFLYFRTPYPHSFSFPYLFAANLSLTEQTWVFFAFLLAFAVKTPLFPFHTWQPETYNVAPHAGRLILSGVLSKMGVYGMLRLMIPICPIAMKEWGFGVLMIIVFGVIYASIITIRQKEMKWLIAYSSIAHLGIIAAGILTASSTGISGGVIQMVAHGVNIVGLFIIIDLIEDRTKTSEIKKLGGIASQAPWLAVFFMIFLLGAIALPLTNGFVGEFLILLGIFLYQHVLAVAAGLSMILSAVYMLQMYQRSMLGTTLGNTENIRDLSLKEAIPMIPLAILVFWFGIFPNFIIDLTRPAINEILNLLHP